MSTPHQVPRSRARLIVFRNRRTNLMVPFLNFMSIIAERAGGVHIRVGGNTQETAYMVDSLPDGKILEKDKEDATNPVRSHGVRDSSRGDVC